MPELPEVETIRRGLRKIFLGRVFSEVIVHRPSTLRSDPAQFASKLMGRRVQEIGRRGKHLLFALSGDATLLVHLGMTGQLTVQPPETPLRPHTQVVFRFIRGRLDLRYRDVRRFGYLQLVPTSQVSYLPQIAQLGPEPLSITYEELAGRLQHRRGKIKPVLLSQTAVCGLGNIYTDEVLFAADIHPEQPANTLSPDQLRRLQAALIEILTAAIEAGGSSIDRAYVRVDGSPGTYQQHHAVYGRAHQPCYCCGTPIRRYVLSGRSTYFCPQCQRLP